MVNFKRLDMFEFPNVNESQSLRHHRQQLHTVNVLGSHQPVTHGLINYKDQTLNVVFTGDMLVFSTGFVNYRTSNPLGTLDNDIWHCFLSV